MLFKVILYDYCKIEIYINFMYNQTYNYELAINCYTKDYK